VSGTVLIRRKGVRNRFNVLSPKRKQKEKGSGLVVRERKGGERKGSE
jgi:hypothetical protein